MLSGTDPDSAAKIHPNNVRRVIRALEIYMLTGKTKTEWDAESKTPVSPYRNVRICLDFRNRENLYSLIDKRTEAMFGAGLVNEVRNLDCEEFRKSTASEGIGYKEVLMYLDGRITYDEAVEAVKKRQEITRNVSLHGSGQKKICTGFSLMNFRSQTESAN